MLPSSHSKITHPQATRRVTPTAHPPPKTAKVECYLILLAKSMSIHVG